MSGAATGLGESGRQLQFETSVLSSGEHVCRESVGRRDGEDVSTRFKYKLTRSSAAMSSSARDTNICGTACAPVTRVRDQPNNQTLHVYDGVSAAWTEMPPRKAKEPRGNTWLVLQKMSSALFFPICAITPWPAPSADLMRKLQRFGIDDRGVNSAIRVLPDTALPARLPAVWTNRFRPPEDDLVHGVMWYHTTYCIELELFLRCVDILEGGGDQDKNIAEVRRILLEGEHTADGRDALRLLVPSAAMLSAAAGGMEMDDPPMHPAAPSAPSASSRPAFGGLSSGDRRPMPSRRIRARLAAGKTAEADSDAPSPSTSSDDDDSDDADARPVVNSRRPFRH